MTDVEDNIKIKFIEILLIVGGIIGGLGYKSEDSSVRLLLALFLISALMYYFEISNQKINNLFAFFTSVLFSVLITYPILSGSAISFLGHSIDIILGHFLAYGLFIIIFLNLRDKSEQEKSKTNLYFIFLIGSFITSIALIWLENMRANG